MNENKKFRFRFSPLLAVLLIVSLAVFITGIVFNAVSIVKTDAVENSRKASMIVSLAVCTLSSVLVSSVLLNSKYTVKKNELRLTLGFFYVKRRLDEISEICLFASQNKLVAYFTDGKLAVIMILPKKYDDFGKFISNINGKTEYTSTTDK